MATSNEFAEQIKRKYPEYSSIPNDELIQRIVEKYPVYRQQISDLEEEPEGETGFSGFLKGVGQSALRAVRSVSSVGEQIVGAPTRLIQGGPLIAEETAATQLIPESAVEARTGAERAGQFAGELGQFLLPGGAINRAVQSAVRAGRAAGLGGKSLKALELGVKGSLEGATGAAVVSGQRGDIEEAPEAAAVGFALPVLGGTIAKPAIDAVKRFLGAGSKNLAATISGKGGDVIEAAIKDPEVALRGLKGESLEILTESAQKVRGATRKVAQDVRGEYGRVIDALPQEQLAKEPVVKSMEEILDSFGVQVKGAELDFSGSAFVDADEKLIERIVRQVQTHNDLSPKGLNNLAVKLNKFVKGDGSDVDSVALQVKRATRNYVGDSFEEVSEINRKFADRMDFVETLEQILAAKGATQSRLGVMKTTQRLGQLFNANKQFAREMVEQLERETGESILALEAGRQLGESVSRASASIGTGSILQGILQTVIPPQVVAELALRTGISVARLQPIMKALEKVAPGDRTLLLQALLLETAGVGDTTDENQLAP